MITELYHYGTPHVGNIPHSGRYPYGSGDDYNPENEVKNWNEKVDFITKMENYKSQGLSDSQIAEKMGISSTEFRKRRSIARAEIQAANIRRAERLKDHGYSNREIARIMFGDSSKESTIRGLLSRSESNRKTKIDNTADILEEKLKEGKIIDIGYGSELDLGVTKTTLEVAVKALVDKGYVKDTIKIRQPMDPSKATSIAYIAPPGTTKKDVWDNRDSITTIQEHSLNKGMSFQKYENPSAIDDERIEIVYKEDGGVARDGLIGIRRGVDDISLGASQYAQVRIAVNVNGKPDYYIKGMAVYDDTIPEGKDIIVYSNKSTRYANKAEQIEGALKQTKPDPSNPFGAVITAEGQRYYSDKNGKYIKNPDDTYTLAGKNDKGERYSLSPVNKLKWEGQWEEHNKNLSAQFLSKQSLKLINQQLDLTYKNKKEIYDEIMALTNPVIKQKMLDDFAEKCDKDARTLKVAALPRQTTKVLIPVPEMKDNEVYAPTYKNGEKIALVRYPHAGTFEIPILTVNNNVRAAKNLLGNALDAIGINKKVADRLSGADFDGDTVITIPTNDKIKITATKLKEIEGFDPSEAYPGYPGMKVLSGDNKQREMGKVTNLIQDMTLQNPKPDELARAVKHSMVIIDAEKHNLNWKQSEKDNGIDALKQKYQKNPNNKKGYGGASSLITRAKSIEKLPVMELVTKEGKKAYTADPETGKKLWKETGETYVKPIKDKEGKLIGFSDPIKRTKDYYRMDLIDDARKLSNGTPQEEAYASYANKMKALANQSRKESLNMKLPKKDPVAAKTYAKEVDSLTAKYNVALKNKPLERKALLLADTKIKALEKRTPEILLKENKDKYKKEKSKIITESRYEVGANGKNSRIDITDKEWEAIQAYALSSSKVKEILAYSDQDRVVKLATPRENASLSSAKVSRIKSLSDRGFTISEIADMVGTSTSSVEKYM